MIQFTPQTWILLHVITYISVSALGNEFLGNSRNVNREEIQGGKLIPTCYVYVSAHTTTPI